MDRFGAFSPIMQLHGLGNREPWNFSAQILETYKFYSHLHLDLFSYIFTYAQIASQTGITIMRAMPFAFPQDPGIWNTLVEHEYMFGPDLLIAPVYFGHTKKWQVYLPQGKWCDFWSGAALQGGSDCIVDAGLDQIPVFARAGAIIPFLDGDPDTLCPVKNARPKLPLLICVYKSTRERMVNSRCMTAVHFNGLNNRGFCQSIMFLHRVGFHFAVVEANNPFLMSLERMAPLCP